MPAAALRIEFCRASKLGGYHNECVIEQLAFLSLFLFQKLLSLKSLVYHEFFLLQFVEMLLYLGVCDGKSLLYFGILGGKRLLAVCNLELFRSL